MHCSTCWKALRRAGNQDVTLDKAVIQEVLHPGGAPPGSREARMASFIRWDGEKLWIGPGEGRQVPPIAQRKGMVLEAARQLGYPGGQRLYQLLKERYYWPHM